jgi:hypothetical protein
MSDQDYLPDDWKTAAARRRARDEQPLEVVPVHRPKRWRRWQTNVVLGVAGLFMVMLLLYALFGLLMAEWLVPRPVIRRLFGP